ncbi:MAG: hypothetical protein E7Z89_04780 [Cyanobacteria bacterium SIG28]|nr:hypothetical protein [Cyanobacteria bacterium SIG28]
MQVTPKCNYMFTNYDASFAPAFEHKSRSSDYYTKKQKATVMATTALGVAASTAILAKRAGYSLKPEKMFKNIKKSYLANVKYKEKEVITIGAGSCLGGLAGGYMIDKNKENRKAKNRETLMHFGNIAIPILTVGALVDNVFEKSGPTQKAIAGLLGVTAGIFLANIVMNKVCNFLFQDNSKERGVELTDLPAHLDDVVVAANLISDAKPVKVLGRVIPLALMVSGNEAGTATAYD